MFNWYRRRKLLKSITSPTLTVKLQANRTYKIWTDYDAYPTGIERQFDLRDLQENSDES